MKAQKFPRTVGNDPPSEGDSFGIEEDEVELSREIRDELLDPQGWNEVLGAYARTVGLAVALTDCAGRQLGTCHNPQPAWLTANTAKNAKGEVSGRDGCSFCLDLSTPCQAAQTSISTGQVQMAQDLSGMVHLAVPLLLGRNQLGALIAGQVFDQYPEPLRLQRLARDLGISSQDFWQQARTHPPIRNATLHVYGELLLTLGNAFLRQRYGTILDRKLAVANRRLRLLVGGIKGHALFTVDGSGLVTSWNQGAESMFGYQEKDVLGQDFSSFFTPEDISKGAPADLIRRASHDGSAEDQRWQVRKDGSRFFAEGSLTVMGKGSTRELGRLVFDVTDRRSDEEALRQTQKLESIGVLASGIAHDFNNLLTGILTGVSFARISLPPDHPAYTSLSIAEDSAEKAADLTHQLLAYGGQGKFIVSRFDLSTLIREMLKLLQTSIPRAVKLQLALEPNLPLIEGDASQLQQVVMNLVINGAESIGPEGGALRVSTGVATVAEKTAGSDVYMEVRDSGSGMTDATKARIFDPFFTTKFTGRGLGLAAVSGIVRGHHGTMQVESILGKGSTFRVCFPGVEERSLTKLEVPTQKMWRGSGTVLVVDDEPSLRKMAQVILEHCGYDVLMADDGRAGVEMFRQHADIITAVLLDMTMPVMGGAEAFQLMRAIRPHVPIVVSTGYSEIETRELFADGTIVGFVQKPFTAARLCERIKTSSEAVRAVRAAGGS